MFLRGSQRPPQDKPVLHTIARAQKRHASAMTPTTRPRGAQWASLPREACGRWPWHRVCSCDSPQGRRISARRLTRLHGIGFIAGEQPSPDPRRSVQAAPLARTDPSDSDQWHASLNAPLDVWMPGTTLCAARGSVRSATGTRWTRRARSRHPLQPGLVECCETKTLEQFR
jgi:hypothetical protein